MRSIVTPSEDALPILSQIATSRLNNSRAVALRGNSDKYWNFVRFYSVLGLMNSPFVSKLHDLSVSETEAKTMSFTDILSRASSIQHDSALNVSRISTPYPNELGSAATQEITKVEGGREGLPPSPDALLHGAPCV